MAHSPSVRSYFFFAIKTSFFFNYDELALQL
jgi:hypothetical protein